PHWEWSFGLLSFGVAIGLTLAVILWPLQRPALPRWVGPLALALSLALPLALCLTPIHAAGAASLAPPDFLRAASGCFRYGLVNGAPLLVLLYAVDRRSQSAWWFPLLGGALGGLAANLALLVHCPVSEPLHLLWGHASVSMVSALVY